MIYNISFLLVNEFNYFTSISFLVIRLKIIFCSIMSDAGSDGRKSSYSSPPISSKERTRRLSVLLKNTSAVSFILFTTYFLTRFLCNISEGFSSLFWQVVMTLILKVASPASPRSNDWPDCVDCIG